MKSDNSVGHGYWEGARRLVGTLGVLAVAMGGGTPLQAAGTEAAVSKPAYVATVSEAYTEKVAYVKNGTVKTYYVDGSAKYSVKAVIALTGVDLSQLDRNTHLDLTIGKIEVHQVLGDDPKYVAGRKTAKLTTKVLNELNKAVSTQTVTASWNAKTLTVVLSGVTRPDQENALTAMRADGYSGMATGSVAPVLTGRLILGPVDCAFASIPMTGRATTKLMNSGDKVKRSVTSASIKGKGVGTLGTAAARGTSGVQWEMDAELVTTNTGGTLRVGSGPLTGAQVVVPPGAVAEDTTFFVAQDDMALRPNSGTYSGCALNVATDGATNFNEPLRITVPILDDDTLEPVPYYVDDNGVLHACQVVTIDRAADTMTFATSHASLYTWIYELITGHGGEPAWQTETTFLPSVDGFQVVNNGSSYNGNGECFGMSAYAQWNFENKGGGLYQKYMMPDLPLSRGGTVKGQEVIATRAHTSYARAFQEHYVPILRTRWAENADARFASIKNTLKNTHMPAVLDGRYTDESNAEHGHAFLAIDHNNVDTLRICDPNFPGGICETTGGGELSYGLYTKVVLVGDGSFGTEPMENIYLDAERDFSGSGAAQVNVTSYQDGDTVTERTVTLSGTVESGEVLVEKLEVLLNDTTTFDATLDPNTGAFSVPISLVSGVNKLTFVTKGYVIVDSAGRSSLTAVPNTRLAPFELVYNNAATVLVTLAWNTDDTDLDLYVIDPTGDYSAYYHKTTADGGELDYDDTNGYGPEHWTLLSSDTVRWGQNYRVRLHYYSDHQSETSTVPTRWTVTVSLYEGTARTQTFFYTGVLAYDNSSNYEPLDSGADWADVCVITPVETTSRVAAAHAEMGARGVTHITVPVPSAAQCEAQKKADRLLSR